MKYFFIITLTFTLIEFTIGDFFEGIDDYSNVDYSDDVGELSEDYPIEAIEKPKPMYKLEDAPKLFDQFVKEHGKKYKNEQDRKAHFETFKKSLKEINELNSDKDSSSTADINLFADLSSEERRLYLGVALP